MNITKDFTWEEMIYSHTAEMYGIQRAIQPACKRGSSRLRNTGRRLQTIGCIACRKHPFRPGNTVQETELSTRIHTRCMLNTCLVVCFERNIFAHERIKLAHVPYQT